MMHPEVSNFMGACAQVRRAIDLVRVAFGDAEQYPPMHAQALRALFDAADLADVAEREVASLGEKLKCQGKDVGAGPDVTGSGS